MNNRVNVECLLIQFATEIHELSPEGEWGIILGTYVSIGKISEMILESNQLSTRTTAELTSTKS